MNSRRSGKSAHLGSITSRMLLSPPTRGGIPPSASPGLPRDLRSPLSFHTERRVASDWCPCFHFLRPLTPHWLQGKARSLAFCMVSSLCSFSGLSTPWPDLASPALVCSCLCLAPQIPSAPELGPRGRQPPFLFVLAADHAHTQDRGQRNGPRKMHQNFMVPGQRAVRGRPYQPVRKPGKVPLSQGVYRFLPGSTVCSATWAGFQIQCLPH